MAGQTRLPDDGQTDLFLFRGRGENKGDFSRSPGVSIYPGNTAFNVKIVVVTWKLRVRGSLLTLFLWGA